MQRFSLKVYPKEADQDNFLKLLCGCWDKYSHIANFGTDWYESEAASCTLWHINTMAYPLDKRQGGLQKHLGHCMEETNLKAATRIWTLAVHFVSCHYWLGCHSPGSFLKKKKVHKVHKSLADTLVQQFSSISDT
jgi:hypothetical protein